MPAEPAILSVAPPLAAAPAGPVWTTNQGSVDSGVDELLAGLEESFQHRFSLLDLSTGRLERVSADWLGGDLFSRLGLCEEIANRNEVEVIEECAPLIMVAIPLAVDDEPTDLLAVATFLTQRVDKPEQIVAAAKSLGVDAHQALAWSRGRQPWPPHGVLALARARREAQRHRQEAEQLQAQLTDVSAHLLSTFEELSVLHRLAERLSLSSGQTELCELSLQWLADIVPAESLVVVLNAPHELRESSNGRATTEVLQCGKRLLPDEECPQFIQRLGPEAPERCLVLNRDRTNSPTWCYPDIRELISAPIRSGERVLGWMLAMNHKRDKGSDRDFGAVEASLLSSVAAILGVHAGNIDLYNEQSDFFESVIRALSSSIDAKDPYTCGHSDRVARLSVCLAKELGCDAEELNTIYLSGLLHDIGKIGIDDNVLRKPGKLTDAEYEHIKTHPELGYRILQGVKQLDKVLPVVLHHHEAWDGGGYPAGLAGEDCPKLARIVAVADSIDAMGSDRPYRKGMPAAKLEAILADGAGKQWDPEVVAAYLRVRDEVHRITATDRAPLSLDVREWVLKSS